jgi:tRNA1Val (adenine37-N6)-methyltransferase
MGMSNNWFQFRRFRIEQQNCAMKITTDACIQGAWTPIETSVQRVLDIGAGTGLLSLMLAQRNTGITIDAIEYDKEAAIQAIGNVAASPWHQCIQLLHSDVRAFEASTKYDLIICNPPFFTGSLLSGKESQDKARHDVTLSRQELLQVVKDNLANDGYLSLLLPYSEYLLWKEPAEKCGLYESKCLHINHKPDAPVKRVVTILARSKMERPEIETLTIKENDNEYTDHFKVLLGEFYLNP